MLNVVLLPATDPADDRYGQAPDRLDGCPDAVFHHIRFPSMVWYNADVRRQAIAQIEALALPPVILIGFSKSGLGAWNIARAIPGRIAATIIFDAPVARDELPPWGTAPFYDGDCAWQADLPLRTIAEFQAAMPATHRLVLVSGASFHAEMARFAEALAASGLPHTFLPRPHLSHDWQSGWIEEGLGAGRT